MTDACVKKLEKAQFKTNKKTMKLIKKVMLRVYAELALYKRKTILAKFIIQFQELSSFPTQTSRKTFQIQFKMFKLVVLSCLVSVALAGAIHQPISYAQVKSVVEPHYSIVETPTVSHVGSVVKSIPTAHSYQSQTQYHSKSVVEPIYAHGVQQKYISTPVVKQIVEHVPVVQKAIYAEPIVAKAAYIEAPVAYSQAVYAPKALSYSAYPAASYSAAYPSAYSAYPAAHSVQESYPVAHSAYSAYPSAHSVQAAYPAIHSAYPLAHSAYSAYPAHSAYAHHY